ncbi:hypothetical protein [Streptomyces flaveolus]|uniref:hypothetical protein n=1 Tax=Streptomyces flaveolus TaxID=67297 RepID=UPI001670E18D|nr:hypothetical protein [Streptomyces flaveolus]GGQ81339.1 hypothetical protein GCM10010216_49000 [Streptomyces flaveolus]
MIVDPGAPQITPPERIVSPDGWFAAIVDELWAGVTLSYNGATPPAARNLVLNPSAEVDLSNTTLYSFATRARITSDAARGVASIQHTQTSGGTFSGTRYAIAPAAAGTVLTASVWVKVPGTGTTCFFAFRSASATLQLVSVGTPAPNQWVRLSGTYTVPAGQTVTEVAIAHNAPVGTVWLADAMMVEAGVSAPSDYVDGSTPGAVWEGAPNASPSQLVTAVPNAAEVLQVRITRTDPGATEPVPVRSGDPAWAVEGVGAAYDHEAPLGVPVIYTATPIYQDGSTGPSSALAVTVPAPEPGEDRDLWVKSIDEPGLSMRVMLVDWPGPTATGRQETLDVDGSPYRAVAYDVHGAETIPIVVDVPPEDVDRMRELLRSGVLLAQARPGYYFPDAFHVPADITGPTPTGKLGSSEGYRFGWTIEPFERPDPAGQPMMLPNWSYDRMAAQFGTYDAVAGSYSSYAALSTDGVL